MATETIRVSLPSETVKTYEEQAKARGDHPVEWLMAERLRLFAGTTSQKPLTIDDDTRRKIERIFGKNISTPEELLKLLERATEVDVDGIHIALAPNLLARLKSRCIGVDFEKFLPDLIRRHLEEYVGLR